MRFSLGQRLALAFAGSLGTLAIVLFVGLTIFATRQTERQAQAAVQTASQVLSRLLLAQSHALEAQSRVLTLSQGIGSLILAGDRRTVEDYLHSITGQLDADTTALVRGDGRFLGASTGAAFGELTAGLRQRPLDQPWSGIVIQSGKPQLAVVTPVRDPASGTLQGALLVFRTIDNRLASDLSTTVGAEIVINWDHRRVAVSRQRSNSDALVATLPVPVEGAGALELEVRLSRQQLLAQFEGQRLALLLAFVAALGLGITASVNFTRALTEPLEQVIASAKELRTGTWPAPLPATRHDELGLLQSVFNEMTQSLHTSQLIAIQALAATVDARDRYTRGHSDRVATYALQLAEALGMSATDRERIQIIGTLHDIGKLAVPDAILLKEGPLTSEERTVMETHPIHSEEIVRNVPSLHAALPGIRHHHERWDGRGYPDGLAGEQIPLDARIMTIADTFDALTSNRPYRRGLATVLALREIERCAGTQFDPALVPLFLQLWRATEQAEQDAFPLRRAA